MANAPLVRNKKATFGLHSCGYRRRRGTIDALHSSSPSSIPCIGGGVVTEGGDGDGDGEGRSGDDPVENRDNRPASTSDAAVLLNLTLTITPIDKPKAKRRRWVRRC